MEVIEVKGAKSFLKKISLENEKHYGFSKIFIFRGQSNADWEIIPSAFRKKSLFFNEHGFIAKLNERSNREQIEGEFYTIEAFCDELNRNGFHIPNEEILSLSSEVISYIDFITKIGRGEEIWPSKQYHSIIAVAQHYGIPTRFVDWTYDPFVAAYFAAIDAIKNNHDGFLTVYATNVYENGFRRCGFSPSEIHKGPNQIYQLIKAPSSFNANLRAQKALFLAYIEKSFSPNARVKPFSFEDFLKVLDNDNKMKPFSRDSRDSYKYVLRASKCKELLSLLHKRFYNISTLFPGIRGCVKSIYESRGLV